MCDEEEEEEEEEDVEAGKLCPLVSASGTLLLVCLLDNNKREKGKGLEQLFYTAY